ncbi:MAG: TonB-dependent receptor [Candidatus Neomarinimicrobiota bacterium]|jgi:outer membrane receptor for ferrienterochelin and colicin|nr:TonB-dependent receptor [Candidatus Neomarinimicrobiota bacterium]
MRKIWIIWCIALSLFAADEYALLKGYVLNEEQEALPGTNVLIKETMSGAATDKDGYFSVRVPVGTYTVQISFMGYKTIEETLGLRAGQTLEKSYVMKLEYFEIGGIIVEAERELLPADAETKTRISSGEIEHMQASNLSDVMQLTPGVRFENPGMAEKKQVSIRTNTQGGTTDIDGDAADNEYFGTQIRVDNIPLSNNANLQLDTKTTTASGRLLTTENSGIDMRQIPADNIESVEIIRGIPSSKYGDLTSGIIEVKTRSEVSNHRIKFKYNFYNQEANMGGGFKLNDIHHLDYNLNYAYSVRDMRIPEENFSRISGQLALTSKLLQNLYTMKNRLYYTRAFDERELREDDLYMTEKYNRDYTLRFAHQSTYLLTTQQKLEFDFSANYTRQNSHTKKLVSGDHTYVTDLMEAGTDTGIYVQNYISELYVLGKAYNFYSNLNYAANFDLLNMEHSFLAGATFRDEFNLGEGRVFDPLTPPAGSGIKRTRPRSYDELPALTTTSFYIEDKIKGKLFIPFQLNLGARLESYGNDKLFAAEYGTFINPRINMVLYPGKTTQVRFGYGETSKAPSMAMLHPNPIYLDVDDVNNIVDSLVIVSTYVFSKENPNLKGSRQIKWEGSIDQRIGDVGLSLTAYQSTTCGGFISSGKNPIFVYKYDYTVSETDPPIRDSISATYEIYENSLTTETKGLEIELQTKPITPLNLRLRVQGAYNYTYSRDDKNYDYRDYVYDPNTGQDVNPFFSPVTAEREKFYINYNLDFKIKELGAWVTVSAQQVVFDKDRQIGLDDSLAVGYLNAHGEQVFFTDAERNAITSSTYKRVYADYLYLDENRKNIWVFNLRLSKSLGRSSEFSFFVNNFFNYQPLYRRLRSPSEAYTRENPELYFGIEISSKIDELFQFKRRS